MSKNESRSVFNVPKGESLFLFESFGYAKEGVVYRGMPSRGTKKVGKSHVIGQIFYESSMSDSAKKGARDNWRSKKHALQREGGGSAKEKKRGFSGGGGKSWCLGHCGEGERKVLL